jgi:hypothetical protein
MKAATLSPALDRALQAGRRQFNDRVSEACRMQPGFDTSAAEALLRGPLDRLATLAASVDPERTGSLLLAAFAVGLTLQLRGKGEQPLIQALWRDVLPACLPLALQQPRDTLGALFNAALYLLSLGGGQPDRWAREMARLAGRCEDLACLKRLGQVLAWRCGVAQFRASALKVARRLPPGLAAAALALAPEQTLSEALDRLENDPWFDPAQPAGNGLRVMREVGGFSGFGGPFARPPEVRVFARDFVVKSADRYWYLCADVFGALLHAGSSDEFAAGRTDPGELGMSGNEFRLGAQRCALDLPATGLRRVCGPTTAAVSSSYSHFIWLLALS